MKRRNFRPVGDLLEARRLLTIELSGANEIGSYAGVGFAKDPIASIYGTNNGFVDHNPSDYSVQVDWGDGSGSDSKTSLAADGNDVLVKGTHIYKQPGTYSVNVTAMGPGGQSATAQTTFVSAAPMPEAASQPITVPAMQGGEPAPGRRRALPQRREPDWLVCRGGVHQGPDRQHLRHV